MASDNSSNPVQIDIPQYTDKSIADSFKVIGELLGKFGRGSLLAVAILNFAFNFGMNNFLSIVRNLSVITHLMMMQLDYPATVVLFFSGLFGFVTFDVFQPDFIYAYVFGWENVPYSDQADEIGYGSRYLIENSGSITLFIVLITFMQSFYTFVAKITSKGCSANNFVQDKRDEFFWGGFNDFYNETYLTLSYCACINTSSL